MKLNIILKNSCFAAAFAALGLLAGCQPEEVSGGNPLFNENVDATFTVTATDGTGNRYVAEGVTGAGQLVHRWDVGNGQYRGSSSEELFFPDAGTYTVTHTVYGNGGMSNSSTQTVTVTTPDPIAGNLILNGKFDDGAANWTILNISASGAAWTFANGMATLTGGDWNQQGIFQAVQVEAGAQYKIDMKVSGTGSVDTWFEVYASQIAPTQGSDYNADGIRMQMNTWAGCGGSAYEGMLSTTGCGGTGNIVTFANSGTAYIVIKGGGANIGSISIDNVEMRRVN